MKVYLDIVFFTNFLFDFILLLSLSIILKRNTKIYRIILGSLFGTFTLLILFIRMNTISLFIYKFIISIFMILITYGYKNIRYTFKNIYFLYIISIVMGGFLYFINIQLSTTNSGLIFITSNFSLNLILAFILSIIFMFFYVKQTKSLKNNYNNYHNIKLYLKDKQEIICNAFLDTGNKLISPYRKLPIILIKEDKINNIDNMKYIFVPYNTLSSDGLLKCIIPSKIYIDGIEYKKRFLVGVSNNINLDGIDCILNEKIMEEL